MTASSTTPAANTAGFSDCPTWCTDPALHDLDPTSPYYDPTMRMHKGPLFGDRLRGWGAQCPGQPMTLSVDVEVGDDMNESAQLLELAEAAREAARWLEEQQRS